ncbi:hypothetical protein ACFYUK_44890 [Nonomuraea wenchangensis]
MAAVADPHRDGAVAQVDLVDTRLAHLGLTGEPELQTHALFSASVPAPEKSGLGGVGVVAHSATHTFVVSV